MLNFALLAWIGNFFKKNIAYSSYGYYALNVNRLQVFLGGYAFSCGCPGKGGCFAYFLACLALSYMIKKHEFEAFIFVLFAQSFAVGGGGCEHLSSEPFE